MSQYYPEDRKEHGLIRVRVVPVQVFGTEECCLHHPHGLPVGEEPHPECHSIGYGVMDAVSAWSDCNRAVGHMYRFDDIEAEYRNPGETLTVWVDPDEYRAFAARCWADDCDEKSGEPPTPTLEAGS